MEAYLVAVALYLACAVAAAAVWRWGGPRYAPTGRLVFLVLVTAGAVLGASRLLRRPEGHAPPAVPMEGPDDDEVRYLEERMRDQRQSHERLVRELEALDAASVVAADADDPDAGGDFAAALVRVRKE